MVRWRYESDGVINAFGYGSMMVCMEWARVLLLGVHSSSSIGCLGYTCRTVKSEQSE